MKGHDTQLCGMASPACPITVAVPVAAGDAVEVAVAVAAEVAVAVGAAEVAVGVGDEQKSEKMLSFVTGPPV